MFLANPFKLKSRGILGMNRRNVSYIGPLNDRRRYPLVDNKLKTKQIAQAAGIAVPELLGVIRYQHERKQLEAYINGYDAFVVKPAQGSGGKGILVITGREGEHFVKADGSWLHIDEIDRHVSNILSGLYSLGGKYDVAMFERLVEFNPIFDDYSFEGVPDIRVILYKGFPVMAMLRCSTRESQGKANLHQGAVGVGISIQTGRAINAVQHNRPVTRHPDTGHGFAELAVPQWEQILTLAASCYEITGLGYLGVDIVLDLHRGPLILELNARPGLAIQVANDAGMLPRFAAVDRQDGKTGLDERVAFSMAHF
jgi:alpha-L-glutamate ligase-like protein